MKKIKRKMLYNIFFLIVIFLGIGYAYLTSNLSITGATEIASNSWDIHFNNLVVNDSSVEATTPASIDPSDNTSISYGVKLNRPMDFYEFTVDIVNTGTIPGKISLVDINGFNSEIENLVLYTISYTENGSEVQVGDILNGGDRKNIKVRVYYNEQISISDLPASNINLNLVFRIVYIQSEKDELLTGNLLQSLASSNDCIYKYTGQVTDSVGNTNSASNVYINRCIDKRNIIFGGYCWQAIRTTDNGGLKLIYNGKPVGGKCESTRDDQNVLYQGSEFVDTFNNTIAVADDYNYDLETGLFTLVNPEYINDPSNNLNMLQYKYFCNSNDNTCSKMYYAPYVENNNLRFTQFYVIQGSYFSDIAKAVFNYDYPYTFYYYGGTSSESSNSQSISNVGYMYNKSYSLKTHNTSSYNNIKFGTTFTYDENTGTYTLAGDTVTFTNLSSDYLQIGNKHYTCFDSIGSCSNISYVYAITSASLYYIDLENGKNINDALNEMLYSDDVNLYDSNAKHIVDSWYENNLLDYTNRLEDSVYCNDRTITDYGGFDSTTTVITNGDNYFGNNYFLKFKNSDDIEDLSCGNIKDQFAVSNSDAKLKYPIALATGPEMNLLGNDLLRKTGDFYILMTPANIYSGSLKIRFVYYDGGYNVWDTDRAYGIRPVISLNQYNMISSGNGSEINPWIIE